MQTSREPLHLEGSRESGAFDLAADQRVISFAIACCVGAMAVVVAVAISAAL